jgi:peptidoglycan biosynthesis protein MviN/MurJ (putative lipid II flippase)
MAILLHRRGRLGGGWLGMIGRIFLASLIMAILLLAMVWLAGGIKQFLPAAGWLACLVAVGGGGFLFAAWCFRAFPAGFVHRLDNRKT